MSIVKKVAERVGAVANTRETMQLVHFGVGIPSDISADRALELEADLKDYVALARSITAKWSAK